MLLKTLDEKSADTISRGLWGTPIGRTNRALPVIRSTSGEWAVWFIKGFEWPKLAGTDVKKLDARKTSDIGTYTDAATRLIADELSSKLTSDQLITDDEARKQGWFPETK